MYRVSQRVFELGGTSTEFGVASVTVIPFLLGSPYPTAYYSCIPVGPRKLIGDIPLFAVLFPSHFLCVLSYSLTVVVQVRPLAGRQIPQDPDYNVHVPSFGHEFSNKAQAHSWIH